MYLANIKLWNFRKYGSDSFNIEEPDLNLDFSKNLNVLIGENDSGKTAIIDAIKIVLKTHSYEWIKVTDDDFHEGSDVNGENRFRIELIFKGFDEEGHEAKYFTEWLSWEGRGDKAEPFLKVIYDVQKTPERILPSDVRAGADEDGYPLSAEARYYLKTTYLKPLRDAHGELIPKRYSRLSQILQEHEAFKDKEDHIFLELIDKFNKSVSNYFEGKDSDDNELKDDKYGKKIKERINSFIKGFYNKDSEVDFKMVEADLKKILESLELSIAQVKNPGLGTLNRLFMATELLHLNKDKWNGLRLGLIEEIEAHLHPQVQMKVIETLQKQKDIQLILTTHSPNLASKINLENLIICKNKNAFPMGTQYTELQGGDYKFLERFLDVTKSNLFFAKGVILVEGWSEEILIPTLAKKLGYDLTENEVSVINVGNLGFSHYYKIFLRQDETKLGIPVSVISDVDVREYEENTVKIEEDGDNKTKEKKKEKIYVKVKEKEYKNDCILEKKDKEQGIEVYTSKKDGSEIEQHTIKPFISSEWTLEWCLYKSKSLGTKFKEVVEGIHTHTDWKTDFEKELAKKLINSGLKKTEIAYKLADIIEKDKEELKIEKDDTIYYLIEGIKYACGEN